MDIYTPSFTKNLIGISEKALRRFESKFKVVVDRPTFERLGPCWAYAGANFKGYGIFSLREKSNSPVLAHRLSHELEIGPIPPRHDVHHKCEWEPCGRPEHLEALSRKKHQDVSPGHHVNTTHCPKGHPYDETNTYYNAKGHRGCRECILARQKESYRAWREANPLPPEAPIPTHCPNGHEYRPDNTQYWKGERRCRRCKADWTLQKYYENREANMAAKRAHWAANADAINAARRLKVAQANELRRQAVESSHGKV